MKMKRKENQSFVPRIEIAFPGSELLSQIKTFFTQLNNNNNNNNNIIMIIIIIIIIKSLFKVGYIITYIEKLT